MPTFLRSIVVEAPVETVFAFHEREDALRLLRPRFLPLRLLRKTGSIEPGSRVELKIGPFLWTALHTAYEKNRLFTDEQVQGPFAKWVHRHEFESVGRVTRLTDRVEYRLPGGPWMNHLFGWAVQFGLHQMFRQRHQITRHYCEKGAK
ncbi:SRPBCC family protein [Bryobacter aggregatus]|uniref:SRPBCC family protein n=1 Tax=Bryobacter aggregatus TaxID=360054 RepID=UPI0004E26FD5|nr:SRPBCC family protein [Bryobacter aggregatus]